jgi:hypothetical protein
LSELLLFVPLLLWDPPRVTRPRSGGQPLGRVLSNPLQRLFLAIEYCTVDLMSESVSPRRPNRVGLTGEKLQNEGRTGFSWKCPGKLVTELAVVSSRRARLQAVVAQTWLAPGEHSRCMNREWESEIPNVSCRGSVGVRPQ